MKVSLALFLFLLSFHLKAGLYLGGSFSPSINYDQNAESTTGPEVSGDGFSLYVGTDFFLGLKIEGFYRRTEADGNWRSACRTGATDIFQVTATDSIIGVGARFGFLTFIEVLGGFERHSVEASVNSSQLGLSASTQQNSALGYYLGAGLAFDLIKFGIFANLTYHSVDGDVYQSSELGLRYYF